ncbi:class I SAM-dependent methyltransferase [Streptomyces sp. NPDC052101]|uniref:class I SAM-dependent methyltransferase n=1 Tax=Streptomyces sp. NPDC052101 TaxID=3155763 RepID=UPI00343F0686
MNHLPPPEPGAALRVVEDKAPPSPGMNLFGIPSGEVLTSDPSRLARLWEGAGQGSRPGVGRMNTVSTLNVVHERQTPEYWDAMYAKGYRVPDPTPFERQMFRNYAAVKSGQRVVDVGCGQGRMAAHMATWGLTVRAFDFSGVAIEHARASHQDHGDLLTFARHDFNADAIPGALEPGSVNIMVCRHSLEFLDLPRFLTDARRWLIRSGVLHITTHRAELMPPTAPHRGLTGRQIEVLRPGWQFMTTYGLDGSGSLIGIVLRGPC